MRKATKKETKIRIAREELEKAKDTPWGTMWEGMVIFSELRKGWERRCVGDFDQFLLELMYEDKAWIKSIEIYAKLDQFIDSSIKYYDLLGYHGILDFNMLFENNCHRRMDCFLSKKVCETLDDRIEYKDSIYESKLKDNKFDLIFSAVQKISWSYGWDIHSTELSSYYDKYKKK